MKLPLQFRIITLFIAVVIVALFLSAYQYFSASARYKRNGDVETLRYLLRTQIDNGDTIERVSSVLGPGRRDDGTHLEKLLIWKAGPHFNPQVIGPDGIEVGDQIVFYAADPKPSYQLQFRDGILINFDSKAYEGPDDTISGL